MRTKQSVRRFQRKELIASIREQFFKIRTVCMLVLTISIAPVGVIPKAIHLNEAPRIQAGSTLTFTAEADAHVQESNPSNNYGSSTSLLVNGVNNPDVESFIRFTVTGATTSIQSARLRVYVTTNASANGPAVYGANNTWTEAEIMWKNRPARTSDVLDNKGSTTTSTWVEYSVSPLVTGDGTYTFVLVADSSDGITFSSREGIRPPQLVITLDTLSSTPTFTPTSTATTTSTPTATATAPSPTNTGTPTPTMTQPPDATSTPTPTVTATTGPGNVLTFIANADARVSEASRTTNYGIATTLTVDGDAGQRQISYIRFTVNGVSGSSNSVKLRVFCTTNGTNNGPAIYLANSSWTESGSGGITWNNRPAVSGAAVDNKTVIGTNSWVEYDVTSLVTGNSTYTFALVADGNDGVVFSSREGTRPPQLVVTLSTSSPTNTPTPTQDPTQTNSPTPTAVSQIFNFTPIADSYVDSSNPSTNYGSQTQLRGDGSPVIRSYLRFSVQGLSGTVTRATLRIFANNSSTGGYEIRSMSNNTWVESTITYNNAPPLGNVLGSSGSFNAGVWTLVDITPYITGNSIYNLALTVPGSTSISFASRETGNNAPRLIIETEGGTSATSTPTATATSTPSDDPTVTPTATSSSSIVLVGAGDIANCSRNQDELTAQLLDNIPGTVFTTGDNAYVDGSYTEYINCYDPTWGRHKPRTKPSPGNHDYLTSGAAGYFQYFNNIPSFYAYNLGTWRIYALNSEISVSATSAQVTWLQNDLATNPSQCVLAYWHKPRWSSGANHGDTSTMQTLWQVLYNAGAELVINGHEHQYERFAEMNASGAVVSDGLREIVAGTGGAGLYPFGSPHPASQVRDNTAYGVLKLTLRDGNYDWQFVPATGFIFTDSGSGTCH